MGGGSAPGAAAGSNKKRSRPSGASRRAKKAAADAEGGHVDKGRQKYRDEGNVLVTGTKRDCLQCAVINVAPDGFGMTLEGLVALAPGADQNTSFAAVDAYLRDGRGWSLPRVSREFLSVPGGPELAVLRETGRRLVLQLALTYNNADKNPDLHCVAYDGTVVKDNSQHSKVKEVIASDRSDPASALAVLQSLFKGLKVHVKNVYELRRV